MCVASYGAKWLKLSNLVEIHTSQVYAYHNIWFGFQTSIEPSGGHGQRAYLVLRSKLGKNNESMEDYLRKGIMSINFGYNIYQIN
jgi:hypothetical protein